MSVQTSFVDVPIGQWVQIAEYRADRRSLIMQLQDGIGVFCTSTAGPFLPYNGNLQPAGIIQQAGDGVQTANGQAENPTILRLSKALDADTVIQAWYAWIFVSAGGIQNRNVNLPGTGGTFIVPDGVASINLIALGAGGGSMNFGDAANGGASGGGGAAAMSTLAVSPGQILTYQNGRAGNPGFGITATPTWISQTGVAPVLATDGALADFGTNAIGGPVVPGTGGKAVNCVGTSAFDGGDGVIGSTLPVPTIGGGGGGGANSIVTPGVWQAGTTGSAPVPGAFGGGVGATVSGGIPFGPTNGLDATATSGSPNMSAGGGGGGNSVYVVPFPVTLGGAGLAVVNYTGPAPPGPPPFGSDAIVTVIEAFGPDDTTVPVPPVPIKKFTVSMPRLSQSAIDSLKQLIQKIGGS